MPPWPAIPGPHDPFNAQSIKLAEATRIRLVLPGLLPEIDADPPGPPAAADAKGRSTPTGSDAQAAAAGSSGSKARRKVSKLRTISAAAQQSRSGVIVDTEVLLEEEAQSDDAEECAGVGAAGAVEAAGADAQGGGNLDAERRASGQAVGPTGSKSGSPAGSRRVRWGGSSGKSLLSGTKGSSSDSEASGSAAGAATGTSTAGGRAPSGTGGSGGASANSAVGQASQGGSRSGSNSQRGSGDKQHVPIWERRTPSTPTRERPPAALAPKVYQAVALKTFSLSPNVTTLVGERPEPPTSAAASHKEAPKANSRQRHSVAGRSISAKAALASGASLSAARSSGSTAGTRLSAAPKQGVSSAAALAQAASNATGNSAARSFTTAGKSASQLFERLAQLGLRDD